MEQLMTNIRHQIEQWTSPPSSVTAPDEPWQRAVSSRELRRGYRFDRTAGFWLGGIVVGVGGCILGSFMSHGHPVGEAMSVLWWGIYLGCFGASIGALLGLWAEPGPASPSQWSDGADMPQAWRKAWSSESAAGKPSAEQTRAA
jgi:hypothetical protein